MLASRDHLLATHELRLKDQMESIERQFRDHVSHGQVA